MKPMCRRSMINFFVFGKIHVWAYFGVVTSICTYLLWTLCALIQPEEHAIYLSTIYLDIDEHGINVEIRVFEDDLRAALRDHTGYVTDTTAVRFEEDVLSYFRKYFSLRATDHKISWTITSLDLVGDSYQVVLSDDRHNLKTSSYQIQADYFFALFPGQKNILRATCQERQVFHVFESIGDTYQLSL